MTIHQDVDLYSAVLQKGDRVSYQLQPNRYGWLQVAKGEVSLNGNALKAGDGVALSEAESLKIGTNTGAEILLFDLA